MKAVKRKLDNSSFIKNAPSNVVDHEKNKYEKVATLCYQYYQEHHDIRFVFKRLKNKYLCKMPSLQTKLLSKHWFGVW